MRVRRLAKPERCYMGSNVWEDGCDDPAVVAIRYYPGKEGTNFFCRKHALAAIRRDLDNAERDYDTYSSKARAAKQQYMEAAREIRFLEEVTDPISFR